MSLEKKNAQQLNVTGTWEIDATERGGPHKGKSTVLLIESGDGIVAEWGKTLLTGSRDGQKVSLRASADGTATQLTLALSSADSLSGTCLQTFAGHGRAFTSRQITMTRTSSEASALKARGESFDEIASRRRRGVKTKTLAIKRSAAPKEPRFVIPDREKSPIAGDGIWGWICNFIFGTIFGAFTEEVFVPMGACEPSQDGGGYYLFGNVGPGARMIFTTTVYYPWEDVSGYSCESREYDFTYSFTGTSYFSQLISFLESIENNPAFSWLPGIPELIQTVTGFYDSYGDFAILGAYNTNTGSLNFYCVCSNEQTGETILGNPVIQTLLEIVATLVGNGSYNEMSGNPIQDSFSLSRNDMWYYPCNSPLIFMYMLGTMPVEFN